MTTPVSNLPSFLSPQNLPKCPSSCSFRTLFKLMESNWCHCWSVDLILDWSPQLQRTQVPHPCHGHKTAFHSAPSHSRDGGVECAEHSDQALTAVHHSLLLAEDGRRTHFTTVFLCHMDIQHRKPCQETVSRHSSCVSLSKP